MRGPKHARQYADGGEILSTGPWIAPHEVMRFSHPIPIGGFPSGTYDYVIEFQSLDQRVLDSTTVRFTIP